jgi:hypothetical protein
VNRIGKTIQGVRTVDWQDVLRVLGVIALIALILAGIVLALAFRALRRIRVPPGADFFTTIRAVPLSLAVGLDLLDLGLDVLSTPIIWYILNKFRLQSLRNVASFEALLPFTGPIPTLTIAWFAARALNLGQPYDPNLIETERAAPGRYVPRPGRR